MTFVASFLLFCWQATGRCFSLCFCYHCTDTSSSLLWAAAVKVFFPSPSLNISSSSGGCMVNLMRELIWLKITFYFLLKCKRLVFSEINPPVKFTAGCTDTSTGREELFPPCLLTDHSSQPVYLLDSRNCNLIWAISLWNGDRHCSLLQQGTVRMRMWKTTSNHWGKSYCSSLSQHKVWIKCAFLYRSCHLFL